MAVDLAFVIGGRLPENSEIVCQKIGTTEFQQSIRGDKLCIKKPSINYSI